MSGLFPVEVTGAGGGLPYYCHSGGAGHLFITIVPVTAELLTVVDENRKGIQAEYRKWLPGTVQDRRSGLK